MQNIVKIVDLDYKNIFSNFNISFDKNKVISISGPNCCGKTTMFRMLDRQIQAESILVNGQDQNTYKITDYYKMVKVVIPGEYIPIYETVEEEIDYYIDQLFLSKEEKTKRLKNIYKCLNLNKVKKNQIITLDELDIIRLQLALAISSMPKIIAIDDISSYLSTDEVIGIVDYLKELVSEYDLTVIISTSRLDDIINTDYLYIMSESKVIMEGKPMDVLVKDNILNKIGLRVPFMVDLSVKLRDYDLIQNIELDMDRMADLLWK